MTLPEESAGVVDSQIVGIAALTPVFEALLTKKSMFAFDAKVVVQRLLEADFAGQPECGVARVVDLLKAIDLGDIDPRGRVLSVIDKPAFAVLDGSRAAGPVAGTKGIELAIKKARECGTGTVAIGNSQWLGTCGTYARMAAKEGLLCLCCSSTGGVTVAAPGSTDMTLGNHRVAWGIPAKSAAPLVIDTSTGAISAEALDWFQRLGLPVPPGVLQSNGQALESRGGDLGWGLGLLCGALAGPLSGGRFPLHKKKPVPSANDSEHFFYVIDISQFGDVDMFDREVHATLSEMSATADEQSALHCTWQHLDETPMTIPLPKAVEQEIRERAAKSKLDVNW